MSFDVEQLHIAINNLPELPQFQVSLTKLKGIPI
jgi:hypothetical protein